ncbi:hypothetical protein KJ359_010013 [Pestalotiopsis sp. 9143b]|nr:hypothetical protein KJ359_010013 [Pestalotiopsis sp. 9143b]
MDARGQSNATPSAHESGTTTMTHFLDHHRDFLGASTPKSPSPVHHGHTRANSPFPASRILKGRRRPPPLDMDAIHATYGSNTRRRVERWNDNVAQASYGIGHASDGTETHGDARAPEGVVPAADDIGRASDGRVHPFGVYPAHDDANPRRDVGGSEHLDVVADGISNIKPLRRRPDHLNLSDARKYGSVGSGPQQARFPLITPAEVQHRQVNWDGSSSIYSTTISPFSTPTVSPSCSPRTASTFSGIHQLARHHLADMENWHPIMAPTQALPVRSKSVNQIDDTLEMLPATTYQPPPVPAATTIPREPHQRPGGLVKSATVHALSSAKLEPASAVTDQFSPLTPWVLGFDQRKATKNLFGDNGWLQDASEKAETAETKSKKSQSSSSKTAGFLEGIKKMAREIAEVTTFKTGNSRALSETHHITVSLDPREQSLLYCELEFALSEALNTYLQSQFNGGRLDPNKLKAVSDKWYARGRPRVLGFRYDLETQLDLISLHSGEFRFYGVPSGSAASVAGLLAVMKGNARTMRVRHLAQPDAVAAKHILDAQALLRLLGAGENVQLAVAECSEFYKRAVERKKAEAEAAERQSREA